jgi:hypothetical protein
MKARIMRSAWAEAGLRKGWLRTAEHYTVRRDDSDLRVIVCPACRGHDVTELDERALVTYNAWPLCLMKCNGCGKHFAFYQEDGVKEISEEEAEVGVQAGEIDLQDDGMDDHGHCIYIVFSKKPPSISKKEYDKKFDEGGDGFDKWRKSLLSANQIDKNRELIRSIQEDEK